MKTRAASLAVAVGPMLVGLLYACTDDPAAEDRAADATADDATTPPDASADGVGPNGSGLWKSGTRLRAELLQVGEARRFARFFDTARNETCEIRRTTDGHRCTPEATAVLFDDDACQMPAATSLDPCGEPPQYVARYAPSLDTCARFKVRVAQMWHRGAEIPARDMFQWSPDGTCARRSVSQARYYALGAEVALTELVHATLEQEEVTPTLGRGRFRGDDGSELVDGTFVDRSRDAGCVPSTVGPPSARKEVCAGDRPAHTNTLSGPFTDPACGTNAAESFLPPHCAAPTMVSHLDHLDGGPDASICTDLAVKTLHTVGAPIATVYQSQVGVCTPVAPSTTKYFALGPTIDPATLPAFETALFGNGRGRVRALNGAGVQLDHGDFFDETVKAACFPAKFADGKQYCLPGDTAHVGATGPTRFKDAGCTQPIHVAVICAPATTFLVAGAAQECVLYSTTGYELRPNLALTEYWTMNGTCDGPTQMDAPYELAYDVLAPVPVSSRFLEITQVRE